MGKIFESNEKEQIMVPKSYAPLLKNINRLLEDARRYSARTVNAIPTAAYWDIGRRIVEFRKDATGKFLTT